MKLKTYIGYSDKFLYAKPKNYPRTLIAESWNGQKIFALLWPTRKGKCCNVYMLYFGKSKL